METLVKRLSHSAAQNCDQSMPAFLQINGVSISGCTPALGINLVSKYLCISYFQAGLSDEASMDYRGLSGILEELHLLLVILEDWILIQRASIDIHIDEEPYHSIQVYANAMTKRYVVRAWGRSVKSGGFSTVEELSSLCADYFGRFVACAGYLGPHPGRGLDLVRVSYPCARWVSRSCAVTFAHDQDALIVGLCSACSALGAYYELEAAWPRQGPQSPLVAVL